MPRFAGNAFAGAARKIVSPDVSEAGVPIDDADRRLAAIVRKTEVIEHILVIDDPRLDAAAVHERKPPDARIGAIHERAAGSVEVGPPGRIKIGNVRGQRHGIAGESAVCDVEVLAEKLGVLDEQQLIADEPHHRRVPHDDGLFRRFQRREYELPIDRIGYIGEVKKVLSVREQPWP
jgi:hypothetical protein